MTEDEMLERFGVSPDPEALPTIRDVLRDAACAERVRQGAGDTELMKLCCVQMFFAGCLEDVLDIWRAKTSSMDADASIDIQLLCGAGVAATVEYLATIDGSEAQAAHDRLVASQAAGDFEGFDVQEYRAFWRDYYAVAGIHPTGVA